MQIIGLIYRFKVGVFCGNEKIDWVDFENFKRVLMETEKLSWAPSFSVRLSMIEDSWAFTSFCPDQFHYKCRFLNLNLYFRPCFLYQNHFCHPWFRYHFYHRFLNRHCH